MATTRKIGRQKAVEQAARQRRMSRWTGLALLFLVVGVSTHFAVQWLQQPTTLPLQRIAIDGEFKNLQPAELQSVVMKTAQGGFFAVDMEAVRRAVERQAWVDRVSIRRIWPDALHVEVIEQVPLARWGKDALLNLRGELFRPGDGSYPAGLPHLNGPEGAAQEVSSRYRQIRDDLVQIGLQIDKLQMDQRHAWVMVTESGVWFELGSQDVERRLNRFINLYRQLHEGVQRRLRSVDLRYTNGFALRWQQTRAVAGMGV